MAGSWLGWREVGPVPWFPAFFLPGGFPVFPPQSRQTVQHLFAPRTRWLPRNAQKRGRPPRWLYTPGARGAEAPGSWSTRPRSSVRRAPVLPAPAALIIPTLGALTQEAGVGDGRFPIPEFKAPRAVHFVCRSHDVIEVGLNLRPAAGGGR